MPKFTPDFPDSPDPSAASESSDPDSMADIQLTDADFEQRHFDRTSELLLNLVDVADAFDRVLKNVQKGARTSVERRQSVASFLMVRRLLDRALARHGVAKIDALAKPFDPVLHRAVETILDSSMLAGMVVTEVKPGYTWSGIVIRRADVVVNQNQISDGNSKSSE